ncbi:unnamed protein product [Brassicogethes aeneus]|uniref:Kinesin motor domain-containing protein n=1 Tax=Brassicogethes aeneus TaxID=1431903 RepID=A0A9P0FAX5_BRAAE|nr:unnamed protein product [Brassicogethes aeneus]
MEVDPSMTMSFIQARDPSILSWNIHGLNKVKANLFKESLLSEPELEVKEDNNLRIFLRVKANVDYKNLYSISEKTLTCTIPQGSNVLRNIKEGDKVTKKFEFSEIFGPNATQNEVFDNIIKPKLLGFINGKNSTLMTYGASGAGKTFTIIGTASNPGLVPRTLEYLFRTIPQLSQIIKVKPNPNGSIAILNDIEIREEKHKRTNILNASHHMIDKQAHLKTYREMQQRLSTESAALLEGIDGISVGVWVCFAEIYNEQIYDLLVPPPPRGKQRTKLKLGNANGTAYIKSLTSIFVNSGMEAYQILQYGLHNLNYAATALNSNSSRSHSIFTIKLAQLNRENQTQVSYFNFCDLAGSERLKKSHNVGERLKESNNINSSLMVLGKCIDNIRNLQKGSKSMVPYRESKLTQIFQRALSGKEDICMIVNVNPCRELFDETQHVLNFSAIAKNIIIEEEPVKPLPKKTGRFSQYMNGRSTSIKPIIEEDKGMEQDYKKDYENEYETVEKLKNYISEMQLDFETKWQEREEMERLDRLKITETYDGVIAKIYAMHKGIQERAEANHKEELEKERAKWREHYRHKRVKYDDDNDDSDVIDLVSDNEDDNDDGDGRKEVKENVIISELKMEREKLALELKQKHERLLGLEKENILLNNKIEQLNLTLKDAEKEYKALEQGCRAEKMELKSAIYELEEKVHDQEALISSLKQDMQRTMEIEEQEESNATEDRGDIQNMLISSLTELGNNYDVFEDGTKNVLNNTEDKENISEQINM